MQDNELLKYTFFGPYADAFTTMRKAQLPYPVLCAHQVHGHKVGVVDREGMTREDFDGYDALVTNLPVAIGVRPENIQVCDICTYDDARFFSARREGYECGRNINSICDRKGVVFPEDSF